MEKKYEEVIDKLRQELEELKCQSERHEDVVDKLRQERDEFKSKIEHNEKSIKVHEERIFAQKERHKEKLQKKQDLITVKSNQLTDKDIEIQKLESCVAELQEEQLRTARMNEVAMECLRKKKDQEIQHLKYGESKETERDAYRVGSQSTLATGEEKGISDHSEQRAKEGTKSSSACKE